MFEVFLEEVWNGDCITETYKINAAPIFYLINPEGNIAYTQYGHDTKLKILKMSSLKHLSEI